MSKIQHQNLLKFAKEVLQKAGLDEFSLNAVAESLCETSLRGIDSHGIRLLPHYVNSALKGRKNPKPNFKIESKYPSMLFLDADDAFGHAAGMKAIELGMEKADEYGIAAVGVGNSSHPGAMGSFALHAARKGYIAFAFTHADALLLSANGKRPFFGTNPICVAAPTKGMEPFCLDMATSKVSWNKVLSCRANGTELGEGIAADGEGNTTPSADDAKCLLPTGEYKGYGLASLVELLCGIFTGMLFGRDIPAMFTTPIDKPRKLGQFYMVLKADGCIAQNLFEERLLDMTEQISKEPTKGNDPVMLPGDREIKVASQRGAEGIPLDPATLEGLQKLSADFQIPLELLG